jgi:hypothetical protein
LLGLFANGLASCSAGGGSAAEVAVDPSANPALPGSTTPGSAETPGLIGGGEMFGGVDDDGKPRNVGTESVCDGVDDNGNGVIDDVDVGKDGLCDCLKIGFLGELRSNAGAATGAFQSWLEARSSVPIKNIGATAPLTAEVLSDLQVLVVGNLQQRRNSGGFTPAEVEVVHQWVLAGGGLMTLNGYTDQADDAQPAAQLLEPMGLGYSYQGRGPGILGMGAPPVISTGIVDPMSPIVEGITAIGVYNAYPVTGDGQVIFREGTNDLAQVKMIGEGRVFAFSDEWVTQDALWLPNQMMHQTPFQQQCNQCRNECAQCDTQCTNCAAQPCQGGGMPAAGETCVRGCDQSCTQCSTRCDTCETACDACSALEVNQKLDIPRFWLNTLRWLTPANECQVTIPPIIL